VDLFPVLSQAAKNKSKSTTDDGEDTHSRNHRNQSRGVNQFSLAGASARL